MTQRLIIGLESGADWASIKKQLVSEGADETRDPSPTQPDVLVVTIPEDRSVDDFLRLTKLLPGVRYAEPDAMRFTY
ncbi:MAG: hypothetical protein M3O61_18355 [Gemmatimonadota bacterium]|nr:hypothetical protein [Gemmatimonadota bacterium]